MDGPSAQKPAPQKEQQPNSDTEEEDIEVGEPKTKKIKLGEKEESIKKKLGKSKIEKRKLSDKEEQEEKEEEPVLKHIKVDEDISFDISMSSPKIQKKKVKEKVKVENKKEPKLVKKDSANLKTKVTTEKPKKKIRKDKSRRTRMSGSNTRSTNIQL